MVHSYQPCTALCLQEFLVACQRGRDWLAVPEEDPVGRKRNNLRKRPDSPSPSASVRVDGEEGVAGVEGVAQGLSSPPSGLNSPPRSLYPISMPSGPPSQHRVPRRERRCLLLCRGDMEMLRSRDIPDSVSHTPSNR
ncbi:hypothetical protein EYF80_007296 [Liparis tanakae]|uniref:Uncharacterized protein n=1 Tax=Liparis tanakae TaxID=230148 RepID=A0A4Z2IXH1_9TELE|nr:hypothetical protein EYF80_007296 [Liparis tanakae]